MDPIAAKQTRDALDYDKKTSINSWLRVTVSKHRDGMKEWRSQLRTRRLVPMQSMQRNKGRAT